jgi:hypothetical protein
METLTCQFAIKSNQELGHWVSRQRCQLKQGKTSVAKLESIWFQVSQVIVRSWDFRFQQLSQYK